MWKMLLHLHINQNRMMMMIMMMLDLIGHTGIIKNDGKKFGLSLSLIKELVDFFSCRILFIHWLQSSSTVAVGDTRL